jgi:hypothetical protein
MTITEHAQQGQRYHIRIHRDASHLALDARSALDRLTPSLLDSRNLLVSHGGAGAIAPTEN